MEKVVQKILKDAQEESKRIKKEGEEEELKIRKETEEEVKKLETQLEKEVAEKLKKEKNQLIGKVRLKKRGEILIHKRKLIERVLQKAIETILNQEKKEYQQMIKNWIKKTKTKEGEIVVGEEERKIDANFVENLNEELGTRFSFKEKREKIKGGVLIVKENTYIDVSIDTLIKLYKEEIELQLAHILFGR
jgi:V/A-type H+-transporting ATPase subunit E